MNKWTNIDIENINEIPIYMGDSESYGYGWYALNQKTKAYVIGLKNYTTKLKYKQNWGKNKEIEKDINITYYETDTKKWLLGLFDNLQFRVSRSSTYSKEKYKLNKNNRTKNYWFHSAEIYFHNGGNWDFKFLIPKIIELKKEGHDLEFSIFAKNNGSIYSLILSYKMYEGDRHTKTYQISFRDSNKIVPGRIKDYSKSLSKMEKYKPFKQEIIKESLKDYNITQEFKDIEEYKKFNNGEDFKYFEKDIDIMIHFFSNLKVEIKDKLYTIEDFNLTAASTAFKFWKLLDDTKAFYGGKGKNNIRLTRDNWDALKQGYRGGFTYANILKIGKLKNKQHYELYILKNIYKYDVNSLYPSIMKNMSLPCGRVFEGDGGELYPYKVREVYIKYAKAKYVPFIEKASKYELTADVKETSYQYPFILRNCVKIMDSNIFKDFEKYYKIEYYKKPLIIQSYRTKSDNFKNFIETFERIKIENDANEVIRGFAKLMLNSVYGKQGQSIYDEQMEIILKENINEDGFIIRNGKITEERIIKKNITYQYLDDLSKKIGTIAVENKDFFYIKTSNGVIAEKSFKYLPLAVAITSFARNKLISVIVPNYDKFVYCDTDSVHLLGEAKEGSIEIDSKEFGKWKFEGWVEKAVYRRAKHYLLINIHFNGEIEPYMLKGGGFNVRDFNETPLLQEYLTIEQYQKENFKIQDIMFINPKEGKLKHTKEEGYIPWMKGKMNSIIVEGGVLLYDIGYEFNLPTSYYL